VTQNEARECLQFRVSPLIDNPKPQQVEWTKDLGLVRIAQNYPTGSLLKVIEKHFDFI